MIRNKDYIFENNNFLNNQHYVIDKKLKVNLLLEHFYERRSNTIGYIIIRFFLKHFLGRFIKKFYKTNIHWFYYLIFHFLLILILSPLYYIYEGLYYILYIFISFSVFNLTADISDSRIYVLDIKKKSENKFVKFQYESSLIKYVSLGKNIFKNDGKIVAKTLSYFVLCHGIVLLYILISNYV